MYCSTLRAVYIFCSPTFQSHAQPFPIVLANVLSPNSNFSNLFDEEGIFVPLSNTVYEFNPGTSSTDVADVI